MSGEMINELAQKLIEEKGYEVVDEVKLTLTQEQAHEIFKSHEQSVEETFFFCYSSLKILFFKSTIFFVNFSRLHFMIFLKMSRVDKYSCSHSRKHQFRIEPS
jgi:nucleoside diphosphate kinase